MKEIPFYLQDFIQYDSEHDTFIYSELAIAIINDIFKNHMEVVTDLYDEYVDEYSSPNHQCDIFFEFKPKTTLEQVKLEKQKKELEDLKRKEEQDYWTKVNTVLEKGASFEEHTSIYSAVKLIRFWANTKPYHGIEYTIGVLKPNTIQLKVKYPEMDEHLKTMLRETYDLMNEYNAKVYNKETDKYEWKFKYKIIVKTNKSTDTYNCIQY